MIRLISILLMASLLLVCGPTCGPSIPIPLAFSAFPNPLEFLVPGESIFLTIEANDGTLASWSVSTSANWILMAPTSGTGNGRVEVRIDRDSLTPGEHSGTIQVITSLGTTTVTVTTTIPQGTGLTGEIAFASNRDGNWNIYAMNVNDKSVRQLTSSSGDDIAPSYTPDGSQIFFSTNRGGNYDIYRMSADTGGGTPVIAGPANDYYPSVSPDGTKIAFLRHDAETDELILYTAAINGGLVTRMKNNQGLRYTYSATVWEMDEVHLGDCRPAWSRDSSKIYVAYWVIPGPTPTQRAPGLAVFSATDPNADLWAKKLNQGTGFSYDSWWDVSPDGTMLAGAANPRITVYDIADGNLEGGLVDPILPTDSDDDSAPTWSADGRRIAYSSRPNASAPDIWVVDTFMTRGQYLRVQLTDDPAEDRTPVWRPQ